MSRRRHTQEEVIAMFRAAHGDKYDYSQVEYTTLSEKVKIICPTHGMFEQRAQMHAQGQECPKCAMDTRKKTCLERYGIELPILSEESREKAKETCKRVYGGETCMCSPEVQAKGQATRLRKYGVPHSTMIPEVREKIAATNLARYGYRSSFKNAAVQAKFRENCMKKYGVPNTGSLPSTIEKRKQTLLEQYGVDNPMKCEEIRQRASDTLEARYGARYTFSVPEIAEKAWLAQKDRRTYKKSKSEDKLYDLLVGRFGENDVERQYSSPEYPFRCDFYIKSRDMYIELNAYFVHGGHWFDASDEADVMLLAKWQKGAEQHTTYAGAIRCWCGSDVAKRGAACDAELNYVVFWDWKLRDAELWFNLDCPDGHDWEKEYSWVPPESLDV